MAHVGRELRLGLTDVEFEAWNERAASLGLSVADFVRRAVADFDPEATEQFRQLSAHAGALAEKSVLLASNLQAIVAAQGRADDD